MKTLATAFALLSFAAFQRAREDPVEVLMKAKKGYAHRLLDAVVQGELDVVRDQAFRLKAVAETADWNVIETPEYVRESEAFVRATERLIESAAAKDADAAALAYMDVTLSCVHCHRYVRSRR